MILLYLLGVCAASFVHLLQPKSGHHDMPELLTALKRAQEHGHRYKNPGANLSKNAALSLGMLLSRRCGSGSHAEPWPKVASA